MSYLNYDSDISELYFKVDVEEPPKEELFQAPISGRYHHNYGTKHSDDHKRQISESMKGRSTSKEHRRKLSEATTKYFSDPKNREHRRQIALKRGQRPPSPKGLKWYNNGVDHIKTRLDKIQVLDGLEGN